MAKNKIINREVCRDFVVVPEAWLRRLVELADVEGVGAQQLKGYISTADVMLLTSKRINEKQYYEISQDKEEAGTV